MQVSDVRRWRLHTQGNTGGPFRRCRSHCMTKVKLDDCVDCEPMVDRAGCERTVEYASCALVAVNVHAGATRLDGRYIFCCPCVIRDIWVSFVICFFLVRCDFVGVLCPQWRRIECIGGSLLGIEYIAEELLTSILVTQYEENSQLSRKKVSGDWRHVLFILLPMSGRVIKSSTYRIL
jgi:hypothetical protein